MKAERDKVRWGRGSKKDAHGMGSARMKEVNAAPPCGGALLKALAVQPITVPGWLSVLTWEGRHIPPPPVLSGAAPQN